MTAERLRSAAQTLICGALLSICAGCGGTTSRIVPTGHGTFVVPRKDLLGLSSGSSEKAKAFQDAVAYCRKLGQDIETVLVSEAEGGYGGLAAPEIEFRCVPSGGEGHKSTGQ
jgi:hypothetical protein